VSALLTGLQETGRCLTTQNDRKLLNGNKKVRHDLIRLRSINVTSKGNLLGWNESETSRRTTTQKGSKQTLGLHEILVKLHEVHERGPTSLRGNSAALL